MLNTVVATGIFHCLCILFVTCFLNSSITISLFIKYLATHITVRIHQQSIGSPFSLPKMKNIHVTVIHECICWQALKTTSVPCLGTLQLFVYPCTFARTLCEGITISTLCSSFTGCLQISVSGEKHFWEARSTRSSLLVYGDRWCILKVFTDYRILVFWNWSHAWNMFIIKCTRITVTININGEWPFFPYQTVEMKWASLFEYNFSDIIFPFSGW